MSESENPALDSPEPKTGGRPRSNQDWWPNQLDLSVLHQHSERGNPLDEDFDYKEAFEDLDVDALADEPLAAAGVVALAAVSLFLLHAAFVELPRTLTAGRPRRA